MLHRKSKVKQWTYFIASHKDKHLIFQDLLFYLWFCLSLVTKCLHITLYRHIRDLKRAFIVVDFRFFLLLKYNCQNCSYFCFLSFHSIISLLLRNKSSLSTERSTWIHRNTQRTKIRDIESQGLQIDMHNISPVLYSQYTFYYYITLATRRTTIFSFF